MIDQGQTRLSGRRGCAGCRFIRSGAGPNIPGDQVERETVVVDEQHPFGAAAERLEPKCTRTGVQIEDCCLFGASTENIEQRLAGSIGSGSDDEAPPWW